MKRNVISAGFNNLATDLLIVGCFEGVLEQSGTYKGFNASTSGALLRQTEVDGFTGKAGQTCVHVVTAIGGPKRVMLLGLGERHQFKLSVLRSAVAKAFRQAQALKAKDIVFAPQSLAGTPVTRYQLAETISAYAGMVSYEINHQKGTKLRYTSPTAIERLRVQSTQGGSALGLAVHNGHLIADAVNHARDLSNEPAADCTPQRLAADAQRIADGSNGTITCTLHSKADLEKMGARGILAVNAGSPLDPVLIELTYTPAAGPTREFLGIVGKGITFDSGGLDLKPADGMRNMKRDMSGAAVALSAIEAIAKMKLPVSVMVVVAATENMIGGKAYKPGDVIHMMNGISVEVDNTDAEGRITLADAISFILSRGVTRIVDLATLTGAVKMIGGDVAAGAFGNDEAFLALVDACATTCGEALQPIRMYEELRSLNDTPMADVKNSGGALAGSTTAAWFLREFAGEDTPWVHLDIAGTAFRDRELGCDPKGATGFGVRTLIELARHYSRGKKQP